MLVNYFPFRTMPYQDGGNARSYVEWTVSYYSRVTHNEGPDSCLSKDAHTEILQFVVVPGENFECSELVLQCY